MIAKKLFTFLIRSCDLQNNVFNQVLRLFFSSGAVIVRMGQAKVEHTGEYKLTADNGHGKDEVSFVKLWFFGKKDFFGFLDEFLYFLVGRS